MKVPERGGSDAKGRGHSGWTKRICLRVIPGSIRELAFEAFKDALKGSGIKTEQVDASIICSAPEYDKQRTPAGLVAEYLGLNPQPTFYVESVCSSSSSGLRTVYALIASGLHDVVMVLGFQKMSEISSAESQERMGEAPTSNGRPHSEP